MQKVIKQEDSPSLWLNNAFIYPVITKTYLKPEFQNLCDQGI